MATNEAAWKIPRTWEGQAAFVVAGGPSALPHLQKLRGRRVIAVNSAFAAIPYADVLFFSDARWWQLFGRETKSFAGWIVTTWKHCRDPRVRRVVKDKPPIVRKEPDRVSMSRTSLSGAICLAAKLGARPIVLLGADGKLGDDGRRHNHEHKYPWGFNPSSYDDQRLELASLRPGLAAIGAVVLNSSPGSRFDMFPSIDLDEFLADPAAVLSKVYMPPIAPSYDFERSSEALARFVAEKPARVLDVGSGQGEYAEAMRAAGIEVTTCDLEYRADVSGDFMSPDIFEGAHHQWFDGVWVSHVLEHQLNVNAFLTKIRRVTRPGGLVAITVPPAKHAIVGGHVSLWNAGLLLYNMVLAGFDCSEARVGTYGYNVSVLVHRKDAELPRLKYDRGDVEALAPFFPVPVKHGFDGKMKNVRW